MGRWIAGIVIIVSLLCAALVASSSAKATHPPANPLSDDFSLGVIDDNAAH